MHPPRRLEKASQRPFNNQYPQQRAGREGVMVIAGDSYWRYDIMPPLLVERSVMDVMGEETGAGL